MSRSTKVAVASTAVGLLALGGGLSIAGQASADPTTSPSSGPSASSTPGTGKDGHRGGPGRGPRDSDLAQKLAEKLGVDQAKVTEALQAVREANKPTSPPTAGASPSERPDPATRDAALAKQLADKLGVTEANVTKALEEIRAERQTERAAALKSRLDEAVKAGTLTQAEADAVTKAVEKGVIGGR